ncbi:FMN-binding protein [Streptomyces sp. TRM68367]|uniref:FMN-binding protein n=1 Tax=Streptomyces sp. TRM68367 TaxID=2758415 RepID=UPI00165A2D34|nr:FMN-binding protein [Streptomyces sp. TRM68367]MBC9730590.1 FMN-binding protein [Streptomyces sp. TRM68367]
MAVRRAALLTTSTVTGLVLLLSLKPHHTALPLLAGSGGGAVSSPTPGSSSGQPSHSSRPSGSKSAGTGGGATGTYTGAVEQTPYGPVQVAITLSHGKLTDVKALQTPSAASRSQAIAGYAVPTLTREALGAQSAQIQAVSGASYTSEGYMQSLQSALDKAGA